MNHIPINDREIKYKDKKYIHAEHVVQNKKSARTKETRRK